MGYNVVIVIPMAGLSRRFTDAGYRKPKFMLELGDRTLFAHAVQSFEAYFKLEPFLFIARDGDGTETFLKSELATLGVADANIVMLGGPTKGQADTVRLGLQQAKISNEIPVTIFNIDTFRPGFQYPRAPWMNVADGYLEVMPGSDPGFSFVLPDLSSDEQRVQQTAEKVVISNLASTGLYWFRRAGDFLTAMAESEHAAEAKGELYIAPLYNALIKDGLDVRYHLIAPEEVIFCGTPAQYDALVSTQV